MKPNTKDEIAEMRLHVLQAIHALADVTTELNLAMDVWPQMSDREKRRQQAFWINRLGLVIDEVRAARRITRGTR